MNMSDAELAERNAIARALDALLAVAAVEAAREEREQQRAAQQSRFDRVRGIDPAWFSKAS